MSKDISKLYSDYIHVSRYARYLDSEQRRETWEETVTRYVDYMVAHLKENFDYEVPSKTRNEIHKAILTHQIMPSMRALMTAGPALTRDNVAGYNCAYVPVDDRKVFDEIMYILMCGTGVGFSVERQYINKLPVVADEFHPANATIRVADSRIGWATAYRKLVSLLYDGLVPDCDYSNIRPAGKRLRTFGGRASGPAPLEELFNYTIEVFQNAKGRKLSSIECHDIVCKVAESIVCGGVRRSALLSLSNLTDERMRKAKSGSWYYADGHRALANNSVCYTETPDTGVFLREWQSLYESKSGERGIFSRVASERLLPDRREGGHDWGTNPCSEIVLRPRQFCNLTEVVLRHDDDERSIKRKVRLATTLGTWQSTCTDFRYLSKAWRDNCEEERLLGVSLTGICDSYLAGVGHRDTLRTLKGHAVAVNRTLSKEIGVSQSAAVTCVKPSGTVSQLVNSASGIHPRYSPFYIRRVRNDIKDPIAQVMIDQGVPYEIDVTNESQYVFSFPIKSPEGATCIDDVGAIEQLELWKTFALNWCEHKPSVSIYVKEDEWVEVASWVYENFDIMSGVSFFPKDDHIYRQAPYEPITEEEYNKLLSEFPSKVDFHVTEEEDMTTGSQELACSSATGCEI